MTGPATARHERVLVTGGAGFVGSHLVDRLIADGQDVLVIDDLSTGRAANLAATARIERVDIATGDVGRITRTWSPETVFHLAAQSSVPRSVADPGRDHAVNVVGTERVAAAAHAAGVTRLVFVSSGGAIYGETTRAATERQRAAPLSPYGRNKLLAERRVASSGLSFAIARPSNIYGPRQIAGLEGAVIAAFVEQALAGGAVTIHGDGLQSRDFVHVRDVVDGLVRLARSGTPDGIWNVAASRTTTILDLVATIERLVGHPVGRVMGPRRAGDVRSSSISSTRLRRLGWRPSVDLPTGLTELLGARGAG